MGRKILMSAAITAATFGAVAGPAFASRTRAGFSNGTKLTARQHALVANRLHAVRSSANGGTAHVLSHGSFEECTVPEGDGAYQNFFTTDTTTYLETDTTVPTLGVLVGTCTADLTKKQISATSTDHPGGKKIISTPGHFATYSEKCEIIYHKQPWVGDAESIVYPDGIFDETCVVPVTIS